MDGAAIYAKTELGLREIKERTLKLPVPIRGLLIMIDGQHTVADILQKAKVLRLDGSAFEALEVGGLIARRFPLAERASNDDDAGASRETENERVREARRAMSDAIQAHMGLRGYALMLKVQRAARMRDLRDLLRDLAAALAGRIGADAAAPIVTRIETLVGRG